MRWIYLYKDSNLTFNSFLLNFKICNFVSKEEFSDLYLIKIQISFGFKKIRSENTYQFTFKKIRSENTDKFCFEKN